MFFQLIPSSVTDSTFSSCAVDRPSGASPDGRMYLVNHFLDVDILGIDIPDETAASTTNGETSIMAQVDECDALYDRYPNFILVSPHLPSFLSPALVGPATAVKIRGGNPMYVKVLICFCFRPQLDWISVGDFLTVQDYLNGVGSL